MKILRDFYERLRRGDASENELAVMDRRAFLFGMTATAAGLVVAPKIFLPPPDKSLEQWKREIAAFARTLGLLFKGDVDNTVYMGTTLGIPGGLGGLLASEKLEGLETPRPIVLPARMLPSDVKMYTTSS